MPTSTCGSPSSSSTWCLMGFGKIGATAQRTATSRDLSFVFCSLSSKTRTLWGTATCACTPGSHRPRVSAPTRCGAWSVVRPLHTVRCPHGQFRHQPPIFLSDGSFEAGESCPWAFVFRSDGLPPAEYPLHHVRSTPRRRLTSALLLDP